MTKDEILQKHEDKNEYHFHQVDREWIMEAMQEYADQQLLLYGVKYSLPKFKIGQIIEKPSKYTDKTTKVTIVDIERKGDLYRYKSSNEVWYLEYELLANCI